MPTTLVEPIPQGTRASLDDLLDTFLEIVPEATGVVVAGPNGNPVASTLPEEQRIQVLAATAMAKLAMWAGDAVAANLRLPGMHVVTIEGPGWKVIFAPTPSHSGSVLVTIEEPSDATPIHQALPGLLEAVDRTLDAGAVR